MYLLIACPYPAAIGSHDKVWPRDVTTFPAMLRGSIGSAPACIADQRLDPIE